MGQELLGRFTEPLYYGEVYRHQPQHTKIVQLAVVSSADIELQDVVYFSNDIADQFYLHSQTGYVMVDVVALIVGNYTFTANVSYTATGGIMESLSVAVIVRVLPEFYFTGTEQDGNYLAYVSTAAPVGTHVIRIRPHFTLLNDTVFNCSIDHAEEGSGLLPLILTPTGSVFVNGSSNSGVRQFVVVCLATSPASFVTETVRAFLTTVFYQLSGICHLSNHILQSFLWCYSLPSYLDLVPSDLTFNSTNGLTTWISPNISSNYQNLLPLANFVVR